MRRLEFLPPEIFMVFRCAEVLFWTALFSLLAPDTSASTSLLSPNASVARKYFSAVPTSAFAVENVAVSTFPAADIFEGVFG